MKIIKDDTVITSIFLMVYLQLTETESSRDNLGPGETSLKDLREPDFSNSAGARPSLVTKRLVLSLFY